MQQTALNLIAIGVFLITMTSLLGGIFHISPFVPAGITVFIMGIATVDTFSLKGRGATIFLDLFTPQEERKRIICHEAGHFLAGYLLGIPITGYSLTPWEALKRGELGLGGVSFDLDMVEASLKDSRQINLLLERLSTTLMAGIAAEKIMYDEDQGGVEDLRQLRQMFLKAGVPSASHDQREKWAKLQAINLIERNQESYENLVTAMATRQPLETCYQVISDSSSELEKAAIA